MYCMFDLFRKMWRLKSPVCFCLFYDSNYKTTALFQVKARQNNNTIKYIVVYFLTVFLGSKTAWMLGRTPPDAIVTPPNNLFNSSSFFTASVI